MFTFITLDSLVNGSTNWFFELIAGFFVFEVLPMIGQLLIAPFVNPSMLWIVTPLLIAMILMQLYYGRNRDESLGWSSAFGNSISLIFVSINLLQFLFNKYGFGGINVFSPFDDNLFLVLGIGFLSLVQLIINYYHLIPKRIAFFVNSSVPTNMTAYLVIIVVYAGIPFSFATIVASLIILSLLVGLFNYLKRFVPMSREAVSFVKQEEERVVRKKEWLAKLELRQERAADALIIDSLIAVGVMVLSFFALIIVKSFITLPGWVVPLSQGVVYLLVTFSLLGRRGLSIFNLNFDGEVGEFLLGLFFGLALFVLIIGLIYVVWFFVPESDSLILLLPSLNMDRAVWLNVLLFALLLPLGGELLFRGVIQRSLKDGLGKHSAVVLQALLFAFTSFSFSILDGFATNFMVITIPVVFVAALVFGYLRDRFGLESAIGAHVSFNVVGLLLFFTSI